MQNRTILAAVLLALGTAASAHAQYGSGLPDTPTVPGPHDDTVSKYNEDNIYADTSQQSLAQDLNVISGGGPTVRQYNQAIEEYKSGKLDDATNDLLGVLKKDPKNAQAQKVLAYTFLRQNKPTDALPYLESSVKNTPKDLQTRDNLGRVYLAMSRPADAAAQFKAVLALSSKDKTATQGLAQAEAKPVSTTATMTAVTRQGDKPKKDDRSAEDYAKMGKDLLKAKKFDAGMDAYNKAAAIDSKNADLRLFIGEQYMQAGQADKAIPAINQALAMNTKHVFEAHTMLGQLYGPTDPAKAVAEFKAATQAKPNDPASWYNLGVVEQQAGDNEGARHAYQKTLDLKPSDPGLSNQAQKNMDSLGGAK